MADLPDWFAAAVLKGWDGSELQTIKCATSGELYILLSALYNSTIKPLKCDTDGNAFLNVKAQDLAEVINRPKYGGAVLAYGTKEMATQDWYTLIDISGKGIVYGGVIYQNLGDILSTGTVRLTLDGEALATMLFNEFLSYNITQPYLDICYLKDYDVTNNRVAVGITPGMTFETQYKVEIYNDEAETKSVLYRLFYALV